MTSNKQNKIFYSDQSSDEEESPVRYGGSYPKTEKMGDKQNSLLRALLVPESTNERSFAVNKASGCDEDESNEATALPKPRTGDPAVRRGTTNLGSDTGEGDRTAHPTTPVHQAMCLLEEVTKMILRSQVEVEMRLIMLERRLTEQCARIRGQEMLRMQRQRRGLQHLHVTLVLNAPPTRH